MTSFAASRLPARPSDPESAPLEYQRAHAVCVAKARGNIERLAARPISAAWAVDGDYFAFPEGFFEIGNWTSSFLTGMALLAFESSAEPALLRPLQQLAEVYRQKVTAHRMDTMHDLGFLYSLYSVAMYRVTGDAQHRETGLLAADELAKRYSPTGGYIQAWGRMDDQKTDYVGLAIIDCLMNLPLLFWAAGETGNRFYAEMARRHAATTLANFVRPDDSVCHAFRFDVVTGAPTGPDNYCGYGVDTHWARGTAWAMYGFALTYRHTRDPQYLKAASRIARRFCGLLDAELVPVWDFRLPQETARLRDSSAAAVAICGFDEINHHERNPEFAAVAEALLRRLCRDDYLDPSPGCPGVLRNGEVGDGLVAGTRNIKAKNVYASWGDYFFMEALVRRVSRATSYW